MRLVLMATLATMVGSAATAQCAGCGAEYNKKERADIAAGKYDHPENAKLEKALGNGMAKQEAVDKPKQHYKDIEKAAEEPK